ncbi:MAG: energy transducer TonB [Alphaproteobacteria bacterium]|nr:energy transducer TonB [Alphaproteobacteria bacterium]
MISLFDNNINNKIILSSALLAIIFHASLIPISSLIKFDKIEETEPKIILELINEIKEEIPVINNINPPEISQPQKVIKPPVLDAPKNIKLEQVDNTTAAIDLPKDIILPDNLRPLINNKIDIPKNIESLNSDLSIDDLPNIKSTKQIKKNEKPIKKINKPNFLVNTEIVKPIKLNDNLRSQNINLPNKPIKQEVEKEIVKKTEIKNDKLSASDIKSLENYKNSIRSIIQSFAINNYPKKDLRRKNEGIVHIIFKLKEDGSLNSINIGPNTNANDSLINAAIDSVKKSSPFEQIVLLKKEREFEINIIYKIN